MWAIFNRFFASKPVATESKAKELNSLFSTHGSTRRQLQEIQLPEFSVPRVRLTETGVAMDSGTLGGGADIGAKPQFTSGAYGVPDAQLGWYASQGFIGYQMMAILAQHWLIYKACAMSAKDSVRNGWDLTSDDGQELTPKMLGIIGKIDKRMRTKWHLQEYLTKGRIFGIRVMMFKVNSTDPDYYKKPFNIDGVTPGSYKGMVQIDPYWIVPELITQNLIEPTDLHFYEPEFWRIGSLIVHRSHLVIYTTGQVADVLKPAYYYGGVSVTQKIYERVYAAERTANEAPMLTMTKRLTVFTTDLEEALANEAAFSERMDWWRMTRDNYGVKINGIDDKIEQFDLTLTDLDAVIMTQYQIVAMIAEVPGTKLLGTQPKGFNSTGEFEESSYHETLESIQENDLTPVLDRHYMLVVQSELKPRFGAGDLSINVSWNELDAMTGLEQAQLNSALAATDETLEAMGAIDAQDVRNRLIANKDSGYNGLSPKVPPMPDTPLPPPQAQGAKPPPNRIHPIAGS
jgi:phage-related protein (TIGR01555 family)